MERLKGKEEPGNHSLPSEKTPTKTDADNRKGLTTEKSWVRPHGLRFSFGSHVWWHRQRKEHRTPEIGRTEQEVEGLRIQRICIIGSQNPL